jgi:hypothetical protein
MSLNPVPGNNITESGQSVLTAPWRAWFDALYQQVANVPYGFFYDTSTQLNVSGPDPNLCVFGTTDLSNQILIDATKTKISPQVAGIYEYTFGIQFENSSVQERDAYIWARKNGTDHPYTGGYVSIPQSHGGVDGHALVTWSHVLNLKAGDYIQFLWSSTSANVSIAAYPNSTTVPYSATPSVRLGVTKIA